MYESIYFNIIYTKIFKNQIIENPYLILSEDHCLTIREKNLIKAFREYFFEEKEIDSSYLQNLKYLDYRGNILPKVMEDAFNVNNYKKSIDYYKDDKYKISISRLETFSKCPYKHFITYNLKPVIEEDFYLQYNEFGILSHKFMSTFIEKIKNDEIDIKSFDDDKLKNEIETFYNEEINDYYDKKRFESKKNVLLLKASKRSSFKGAKMVINQLLNSSFKPFKCEEKFGPNMDIKGIIIKINNKLIYLEGIIDRIDLLNLADDKLTYVIDYKTGNKSFDFSMSINGIDLQLPVYILQLQNKGYKPVGFFIFQ